MSGTILFVTHSEWREARVAPMLQARGYAVERRCPARGDRLPEDTAAYAGAIVFGGAQSANDGPTTPYIQHEIDWIGDYVAGGGRYLGICLGGQLLASGDAFPNQAFRMGPRAFGLQFHPEVRPADARSWFEVAADHLTRPGAQTREQQESGFVRHDPPLEAWLDGFLHHWLEQDVIRPKAAKACAVEREVSVSTGL